jgi:WD40 repeat protein
MIRRVMPGIKLRGLMRFLLIGLMAVFSIFSPAHAQGTCSVPPRLTIGKLAQVIDTSPNNVRALPARDSELVGEIPAGASFLVVDGPTCDEASDLVWWQVDYQGLIGWTAEGQGETYWLEAAAPTALYLSTELDTPIGVDAHHDLLLLNLISGESTNLTTDISESISPFFAWTPDGQFILFTVSIKAENWDLVDTSLYRMSAEGTGKCLLAENSQLPSPGLPVIKAVEPLETQTENHPPLDFPPCPADATLPTPDVSYISIEAVSQAYLVNALTGEKITLTTREQGTVLYDSELSPDGRTAALRFRLSTNETATLELVDVANPVLNTVPLPGEPTGSLEWSADSTKLLIGARNPDPILILLDVTTGEAEILYQSGIFDSVITGLNWSPDEAVILFSANVLDQDPRVFSINSDGTGLHHYETLPTHGPIFWRPNT